jgi:hypothetical protein
MWGVLDPRIPDDLQRFSLIFQRLQVMREGQEINFRRQAHRGMSPVAIAKMPSCPLAATAFTRSCAAFSSFRELRGQGERLLRQGRWRAPDPPSGSPARPPNRAPRADRSARRGRAAHAQIRIRLRMYCAFSGTSSFQRILHRPHAGHGMHRGADAAESAA